MCALPGSADLPVRYQELEPKHLKTSTTLLDPSQSGWKHAELPWFWHLDIAGDSESSDHLKESKFFSGHVDYITRLYWDEFSSLSQLAKGKSYLRLSS